MKKIIITIIITLICINLSFSANKKKVKKPTPPSVVERLKTIDTISAEFIQTTAIKDFSKETYKGRFYLIAGERALWDYYHPYKQYYLFDERGMEYYDSSTNQVIIQNKNSSKEANVILSVLFNFKEIDKNFTVVVNGKTQIQLKPKHDIGLKYIIIFVDSKNNLKGIHSEDSNGSVTEIEFSSLEINKKINKAVFDVKYPADAQVFKY